MIHDFSLVIQFWLWILLLTMPFIPLTNYIFKNFFDKGYLFSKTIGIVISSFILWFLSSLKIAPFERVPIFVIIIILYAGAFVLLFKIKKINKLSEILNKKDLKIFIAEEILFLIGICFWSYVRGFKPEINGLEKYMDFGFINALLKSKYMPPIDIWFAGKNINYYYYGHYICAFLTKLSGIPSSYTYNIMLATVFSFCLCLTFSIASNMTFIKEKENLKKVIIAGVVSALLVTFAGSLHTFCYTAGIHIEKSMGLFNGDIPNYFYPDATRYIGYNPDTNDKTIHEFPLYSFVVADLHGHVSDIPFVLTFVALILNFFSGKLTKKRFLMTEGLLPIFLAVFYMTNTWDYPIYLMVAGLSIMYISYKKYFSSSLSSRDILNSNIIYRSFEKYVFPPKQDFRKTNIIDIDHEILIKIIMAILYVVVNAIIVIGVSQLLSLPYSLKFKQISAGFGIPWGHHTPLYQLFVLWGYQIFFVICFILLCFRRSDEAKINKNIDAVSTIVSNKKGTSIKKGKKNINKKKININEDIDAFAIILSICAVFLIFLPEVIFVKDIYGETYERANTMFKFTYQAFMMFGILVGFIVVQLVSNIKKKNIKILYAAAYTIILVLPMMYPFYAIYQDYGSLKASNYKGLDGLVYLKDKSQDDFNIVNWLNQNVKYQTPILEANGDSYTDYGRISSITGNPTILGWYAHEWLWRGYNNELNNRLNEVQTVYQCADVNNAKKILKKYNIKYIVVGNLERTKFTTMNEANLASLGTVAYSSNNEYVIKVNE
ncbi:MAG: DUF2298 domain-containing protein [Bacillota bacterium]|nr:DUF2298 domain-containing protein [Bacillota bacterium]